MRRWSKLLAVLPVLLLGLGPSGAAEVPGSCHVGPNGLPPGCTQAVRGELKEVLDPPRALPNLRPAVPYAEVGYFPTIDENFEVVQGPRLVRFSVEVHNVGSVAMDLLGEAGTDLTSTTVQQCVAWTERVCRERERVGGFAWHPEHNHFHFQNFATYELRRLDAAGGVDRTTAGLLQVAPKVSFCLMDYQPSRPDAPPGFYVQCLGANQGISPGWADVYANSLPGQGLSIEGLDDGFYALVVRLDPENRLYETDDTDNEAAVVVEIYADGQSARVVGPAT